MPVPADEPDWLTLGQAAKYLGMAQSTIRKWSDYGPAARVLHARRPPAVSAQRPRPVPRARRRGRPATGEGRRLILIVDDDDRLREFVRVNLEMEGYSVREAANADEGLRRSTTSRPT